MAATGADTVLVVGERDKRLFQLCLARLRFAQMGRRHVLTLNGF